MMISLADEDEATSPCPNACITAPSACPPETWRTTRILPRKAASERDAVWGKDDGTELAQPARQPDNMINENQARSIVGC